MSNKVIDPMCGMQGDPANSAGSFEYKGAIYHFCSIRRLEKFRNDPDSFLTRAAQQGTPLYTCPMHPQIVRPAPGNCPICGMTLEPRVIGAGEEESPELADMTRRFWISVALTLPLILIEMADMIPGRPVQRMMSASGRTWIELALATPVVLGRACRCSLALGNRSLTAASTCSP